MEGHIQTHMGDHRPAQVVANPNGRGLQMGFPVAPMNFVGLGAGGGGRDRRNPTETPVPKPSKQKIDVPSKQ